MPWYLKYMVKMDKAGEGTGASGGGSNGDGGSQNDGGNNDPGEAPPKNNPEENTPSDDPGEGLGFNDEQKAYIKKLRKENEKHRKSNAELKDQVSALNERTEKFESGIKKALGLEDGNNLTPEQKVSSLTDENASLKAYIAQQEAVRELAAEGGIPREGEEYLEYLIAKRAQDLEENEELSDETLEEIVNEVKSHYQIKGGNNSTSFKQQGNQNPPGGGNSQVTVEQFAKMDLAHKSQLRAKNPDLYKTLWQQAKKMGLIN